MNDLFEFLKEMLDKEERYTKKEKDELNHIFNGKPFTKYDIEMYIDKYEKFYNGAFDRALRKRIINL